MGSEARPYVACPTSLLPDLAKGPVTLWWLRDGTAMSPRRGMRAERCRPFRLKVTRGRFRGRNTSNGDDTDRCRHLRMPVLVTLVGSGECCLERDRGRDNGHSLETGRPRLNPVVGGGGIPIGPGFSSAPVAVGC